MLWGDSDHKQLPRSIVSIWNMQIELHITHASDVHVYEIKVL